MDQVKFVEDSLQKIWSVTSNFLKAVFHKFYLVHSWNNLSHMTLYKTDSKTDITMEVFFKILVIPWKITFQNMLNALSAMLRKSIDWFLYEGNTGT